MKTNKRRQRRQRGKRIEQLNAKNGEQLLKFSSSECTLELADQGEGKLPSVSMVAYTGAPMNFPLLFDHPVIVDLKGMEIGAKSRPLLRDHDKGREIGHTTSIEIRAGRLYVEGVVSAESDDARRVVVASKNGFPYQASMGMPFLRSNVDFVRAGASVEVNGRRWRGPLYVVGKSKLKEVSVVSLGADDDTQTRIAAMRQEGENMNFEAWLRARDWDPEKLSEKQLETLRAQWQADEGGDDGNQGGGGGTAGVIKATSKDVDDSILDVRRRHAAEQKRIAEIQAVCKDDAEICARAIDEGWTPTKAELEVLKAGRQTVNGIARPGRDEPSKLNEQTLEAALMGTLGVNDTDRTAFYGERTLEAADQFRGIGLQDLAMLACRMSGQDLGMTWGDGERWIRAAFSTASVSNIIENVLNKQALMSYRAEAIQALQICKISRASDFKQVSRVQLLGTGKFEKLGAGGELPSGKLSDQKFTNQADTYGQVIFIDRQTMINDDLQMLQDAGMMLGQEGREVINHIVFTLWLANTGNHFHANNSNLLTGAANALDNAGSALEAATILFRKQKAGPGSKAADKRPINITPRILLVPPELEVTAQILTASNMIGAGATDRGDANVWKGRYQVVSAPHLSDSAYSGYSTTAWYLLANPNQLPTIELLALNGRVEPNIERVNPPANQLGVGFRGYIDVGTNFMDPKGAVKVTGVDP